MANDKVSLDELPKNLLFNVLLKVSVVELCRLRQTSSFLDSFIDENNEKFQRRRGLGITFTMTPLADAVRISRDFLKSCTAYCDIDRYFEYHFSGVAIEKIQLDFSDCIFFDEYWEQDTFMAEWNSLSIRCVSVSTRKAPIEYFIKLAESALCEKQIFWNDHDNFIVYHENLLEELSSAKNCGKIHIRLDNKRRGPSDETKEISFDMIKCFYGFSTKDTIDFHSLATEIRRSQNSGNIKTMSFMYDPTKIVRSLPPMKVLFDSSLVPEDERVESTPHQIRLLELRDRYAVLLDLKVLDAYFKGRIFFFEKDMGQVFDFFLEYMCMEDAESFARRDEFSKATGQRQTEILHEIYLSFEAEDPSGFRWNFDPRYDE